MDSQSAAAFGGSGCFLLDGQQHSGAAGSSQRGQAVSVASGVLLIPEQ